MVFALRGLCWLALVAAFTCPKRSANAYVISSCDEEVGQFESPVSKSKLVQVYPVAMSYESQDDAPLEDNVEDCESSVYLSARQQVVYDTPQQVYVQQQEAPSQQVYIQASQPKVYSPPPPQQQVVTVRSSPSPPPQAQFYVVPSSLPPQPQPVSSCSQSAPSPQSRLSSVICEQPPPPPPAPMVYSPSPISYSARRSFYGSPSPSPVIMSTQSALPPVYEAPSVSLQMYQAPPQMYVPPPSLPIMYDEPLQSRAASETLLPKSSSYTSVKCNHSPSVAQKSQLRLQRQFLSPPPSPCKIHKIANCDCKKVITGR